MYEKLEQCPVCKSKQFDNYMICNDHSISGESFALVRCTNCELVFTNPRPEENNLFKYYKSDQYISHTDQGNSVINLIYKLVRRYTLTKKVTLINKINSGNGILLDYGCGTGDFVKAAAKKGWQAFGYEPDIDAKKIAIQKNPSQILELLKDCPDNVDVITTWHVVEHIPDLKTTIQVLSKKLKKGGHLIIAVPNHQSYDAKQYQENWAAFDVPRHLYHFDRSSISYLIKQLKLKLIDTIPMKFDSYYVSMLSEKYSKKGSLIKALRIGYKSNQIAKKTREYSSLIYVVKK
ncbi:class I SAM-dependent methyltransferase [Ekhidna sp.]|uniref:class I SAM-dependent methyltransferase n=1 Tax=Ekhidna sp. TaxID=2608089 RepID=UPI003298E4F4